MKLNLRAYLFVCLGLIAALPALMLGGVLAQRAESIQVAQSDRESALAAQALAREVGQVMLAHTDAVKALSRQVEAAGTLDPAVLQGIVTAQHRAADSLGNMWVAGADAISIANDPPLDAQGKPNAGTDYSDRDYYKKVKATNATSYSRAQLGRTTRRPNLQVVEPIRDPNGSFIAFSQGAVDLGEIQDVAGLVLEQSPGLRAVVLDQEGRVLAHPNAVFRGEMSDLSPVALYRAVEQPGVEVRTGVDEDDVAMRAAAATVLPGILDWTVVVTRTEEEVQVHAADVRRETFFAASSALLAGLLLAGVLAAVMSRPIVRLASVVAAVGRGDFSNVVLEHRAWHPRELSALVTAVGKTVEQLRARTEELESRVVERTTELQTANRELDAGMRELRRARDEAEAAWQRYQSLFEHNPDMVYSCDLEGNFVSANPAAETILGYSVDELLQLSRAALIVPEDWERAQEHFRRAAEGDPQNYDIAKLHKDGRRIELNVTNLPMVVGSRIVGVYGIAKDITERKALAAEVARLEARREMDKLKSEFVSIASHEFRTPLASLVGFSELLLDDDVDEADRREWVETMHKEATRLSHLVDELLDVSRIEEGRVELNKRPLDVRTAVERVLANLQTQTTAHRVELRHADGLSPVLADPDKLAQVMTNLLSNAIKYSPGGGAVTIAAETVGGSVRISVIDQGLGLPEEELPRLFGRFHRVEDSQREGIEGTGLGLYITKQLVELQGGRIWAESPGPGQGSTFHVELPSARTAPRLEVVAA